MRECEIKEYFSDGIADRISWATRKDAVGFNYQTKLGWFVDHLRGIHCCLLGVGCNVGNLAYLICSNGIPPVELHLRDRHC